MPKKREPIKRAERGSIAEKILLPLPGDLAAHARDEADGERISLVEWIRRAMRSAILRATARRMRGDRR